MKLSYGKKLLLAFIFYGTFLSGVALFAIYTINSQNIKTTHTNEAQAKALEKIAQFTHFYEHIHDKLYAIEQSKTFKNYLNKQKNYGTTRELFLNIAYTAKNIMQLRYIDNSGQEIIRIDRKNIQSTPHFVPKSKLQNKSHRYYFKKMMQAPPNKIWNSPIDLNMENKELQRPFQPVLRVAIPIFTNKQRNGFLIINIFMQEFLEEFVQSPTYNIYMIDGNGHFKAHIEKEKTWTNYKTSSYTIKNIFPDEYEEILSKKEYLGETLFSKHIDPFQANNTIIVVQAKHHTINKEINHQLNELLLIMAALILFSFPMAYLFSKTPIKLKNKVDKLNNNLENKINEKTFELQELNANLEEKIKEQMILNSKKDQLIYHQNKIASLGEMLKNIAHQWRQPLSSISTAASAIKLQKEMGLLNDERMEEAIASIMKNSNYLSQTIDNFRNFFKHDKKVVSLNLAQAIKDDLNILSSTLKDNHIDVIINLDETIVIHTIKNELTQVLLNLITNAKDSLISPKNKTLEKKFISIELQAEEKSALIRIIDNAGGISKEIMDHIFEPYFTTKHQSQGTGIGLFMCEEIISTNLEGTIQVFNKEFKYEDTMYKGALFEIRLPLNDALK